jgi:pimeloyl-ACP methyl ester carboxylesterase
MRRVGGGSRGFRHPDASAALKPGGDFATMRPMLTAPRALFFSSMLGMSVACGGCFKVPGQMRSVRADVAAPGTARCLILLLPGAGDTPEDFQSKGFIDTIRKSGLSVDAVAGDASLGYYVKGMMPDRYYDDVLKPARSGGHYERTWLIGMSMGGLGALMTAKEHGPEITGVLALSPYLGGNVVIGEIKDAGGLQHWKAPEPATSTGDNYDAQLWRFLQAATSGKEKSPDIYVGWGEKDRLADADYLLASQLPRDHVYNTDGGHDWGPWNRLLAQFLATGHIASQCAGR